MNTATRLTIYGAGLILVFGIMFLAGRELIPESTVATWTEKADESSAEHESMDAAHDGGVTGEGEPADNDAVRGLSIEQDGYRLGSIEAPGRTGESGELSFVIYGPDGKPFTDFTTNHEKELHLIVVRSDGAAFQHLHPGLDRATGRWSVPLSWPQAGSYRVFADFVPAGEDPADVTLGRSINVAGEFTPEVRDLARTDSSGEFEVTISGQLMAGESQELTARVTRNGQPETGLEPYLGAFGHLVALREGDLAYLHVHAGDEPDGPAKDAEAHAHGSSKTGGGSSGHRGQLAGPDISFMAEAPTPGRYLLYLDFKVDGLVHTAEFVLEAK